jgi:hypothetical protein
VRQQILALGRQLLRRAHLEGVAVNDDVLLRLDLDVLRRLDLDDLVDRVDDDLVLPALVDEHHLLGAVLVVEHQAVTGPGLDQLDVVLARLVVLDGLLLLAPQRADDDRAVDEAVLEYDHHLVVVLRQEVGAALLAAHRDGDARPEGLLGLGQPRVLHLDAKARVVFAVLFAVGDDREVNATQLAGALRLRHHTV